ncbi:MAG: putative quinol monooxygenase [Steroidobacteraceae bacterium]
MPRITFISRMTVKEGKEADYIRIVQSLTKVVHATEPGTLYFDFFKLREPRRYAVVESFESEDAEHAHMNSAALAEHAPGIIECLDGTWEREYLDDLDTP